MSANSALPPIATTTSVGEVSTLLKEIIASDLDIKRSVDEIDEDVPLVEEGLALDSIVLVKLIGTIETRLGFEFEDSDLRMRSFRSLRTLAGVVVNRLQDRT